MIRKSTRASRMKPWQLAVFATLIASLVLAACGGDGEESAEPAATGEESEEGEEGEEAGSEEPGESTDDAAAAEFFEGETITFLVPHAPGGGTDVMARQLADMLSEYLPGNPNVQVENLQEAHGMAAMNDFANRREPNGLHLVGTSLSVNMNYLFGDQDFIDWDFADLHAIVGMPGVSVSYVHASTGITSPEDFISGDYAEPLRYGGVAPASGELPRLLAYDLLDLDIDTVFGYDGRPAALLALQQGEINVSADSSQAYETNVVPLLEAGEVVPTHTNGLLDADGQLMRDPNYADLPHPGELYEMKFGEAPTGEGWDAYRFLINAGGSLQRLVATHADAPQVAKDAYQTALVEMQDDPRFIEEIAPSIGYPFMYGDDLDALVNELVTAPDSIVDWVNNWVDETYGDAL